MVKNIIVTQTTNGIHNGFVKLTGSGASVYADSSPIPTADIDDREGWLFSKTTGIEKFNYYIYGQGSHPITLKNLHNVFFTGAVDDYQNTLSVPFVVIYTKPTGSGDFDTWYHSRIKYSLNPNHRNNIQLGEICFFKCINEPKNIPSTYRHINLSNKGVDGDGAETEEILYISIHSDTTSANSTKILIQDAGYQTHDERTTRNIKFTT